MEIVIWLVVGLLVGGAIGALATWGISRARGGAVSVMQLKQENDKFRNEVTEHFVETARLINQMSDSYKQVFDHLSSGAEKLVDEKSLAERLPPVSGQEVKLSQFGASASAGSTDEGGGESRPGAGDRDRVSGSRRTEDGSDKADKHDDEASARKDPLKSGSARTDATSSRPATADGKVGKQGDGKDASRNDDDDEGESLGDKHGKGESQDAGKPDDPASKSGSGSDQAAGEVSRKKD